jgi:hypothetical protein
VTKKRSGGQELACWISFAGAGDKCTCRWTGSGPVDRFGRWTSARAVEGTERLPRGLLCAQWELWSRRTVVFGRLAQKKTHDAGLMRARAGEKGVAGCCVYRRHGRMIGQRPVIGLSSGEEPASACASPLQVQIVPKVPASNTRRLRFFGCHTQCRTQFGDLLLRSVRGGTQRVRKRGSEVETPAGTASSTSPEPASRRPTRARPRWRRYDMLWLLKLVKLTRTSYRLYH